MSNGAHEAEHGESENGPKLPARRAAWHGACPGGRPSRPPPRARGRARGAAVAVFASVRSRRDSAAETLPSAASASRPKSRFSQGGGHIQAQNALPPGLSTSTIPKSKAAGLKHDRVLRTWFQVHRAGRGWRLWIRYRTRKACRCRCGKSGQRRLRIRQAKQPHAPCGSVSVGLLPVGRGPRRLHAKLPCNRRLRFSPTAPHWARPSGAPLSVDAALRAAGKRPVRVRGAAVLADAATVAAGRDPQWAAPTRRPESAS